MIGRPTLVGLLPWMTAALAAIHGTAIHGAAATAEVTVEEIRLPEPGSSVEHTLAGGEGHRYPLDDYRGETLWLWVDQDGTDLLLSAVDADGGERFSIDSPGGLWGEEWLRLEPTDTTGDVVALVVRPYGDHDPPSRYRLGFERRRPGAASEVAERAASAAGALHRESSREGRTQALEHYLRAHEAWQDLGHEAEATRALFLAAMLHRRLDAPREALGLLRRALAGWQTLRDRRGEAQATMEIANTARRLGDATERVEETYLQALTLWRQLGDRMGRARTLNYLGLLRIRSAPATALEPFDEALALFGESGNLAQQGVLLNNLGGVHSLMGEPHPALEHYLAALDIHRQLGDLWQEAAVWNNVASVHRRTGRLQEALEAYDASLALRRQLDDPRSEGRVLNNLALVHLALGDIQRARDELGHALELRRQTQDRRGEGITLHNLGRVHAELGEWRSALERWDEALSIRRTLGDVDGEVATLTSMGRAAGRLGHPTEARQHLDQALALLDQTGNRWRRAQALWTLGRLLNETGTAAEALAPLEQAIQHYRAIGDTLGEGQALLELARAERAAGDATGDESSLASAWTHATEALALLEGLRADVDSLELRSTYLASHRRGFDFALDLAMTLDRRDPGTGWAARALELSERARSRGLLDLLHEAGVGLRQGIDEQLLDHQRQLVERLATKVTRHRRHVERGRSAETAESLAAEARQVRAVLEEVENAIRRQSPGWEALTHPRPLAAPELAALLADEEDRDEEDRGEEDAGTLLLEFSLGEERSFLWLVSRQGVEGFELAPRREIETAARRVWEGWRDQDPRGRRADAEAAKRLSHLLLAPLADRLGGGVGGAPRLAIVPDGALHYLPFAALPHPAAPDEPLVARHEVVLLPSASALAIQRRNLADRPPAPRLLAVMADPVFGAPDPRLSRPVSIAAKSPAPATAPTLAAREATYRDSPAGALQLERLKWSGWEAEAITRHAPGEETLLALGFDAGLDTVRAGGLRGHRIVHFATHGLVESEHPELSALVLSLVDAEGRPREGLLRLPELYNLRLDAELVVLSGCRTALGRELGGEGLVGLTRGFFAAGARQLVASHWRVQDRSTAELMESFYRHLLTGGGPLRPAAALRAAQIELMAEPDYRDPYHWAAFALYGDWR